MDVPKRHTGYTHIALDVTGTKAIEASLNQLSTQVTERPITLPNGAVMLFIHNQDKNVIEFLKAL